MRKLFSKSLRAEVTLFIVMAFMTLCSVPLEAPPVVTASAFVLTAGFGILLLLLIENTGFDDA